MRSKLCISRYKKVIALAVFVGALPFLFCASAYAKQQSEWLDDYHQPVGLTYSAQAQLQTTYLWRGIYAGAANIQGYAGVGYGGLYIKTWWNIGVTDWKFSRFLPETDCIVGFSRWGLDASVTYIHNFDARFFDFGYVPHGGNRLEVGVRYTVSSKIPLSVFWATRVAASDHYIDSETGQPVRAFSSYAELSYTQNMPEGFSLYGAIGITPWKSFYTDFRGDFVVQNIEVRLRKDWSLSEHCGMMLQGAFAINPSGIVVNSAATINLALGVYLK